MLPVDFMASKATQKPQKKAPAKERGQHLSIELDAERWNNFHILKTKMRIYQNKKLVTRLIDEALFKYGIIPHKPED